MKGQESQSFIIQSSHSITARIRSWAQRIQLFVRSVCHFECLSTGGGWHIQSDCPPAGHYDQPAVYKHPSRAGIPPGSVPPRDQVSSSWFSGTPQVGTSVLPHGQCSNYGTHLLSTSALLDYQYIISINLHQFKMLNSEIFKLFFPQYWWLPFINAKNVPEC